MKLRDQLGRVNVPELRAIAERHHLKLSRNPMRYELIDALTRYLNNSETISRILAGLSPEQRSGLDAVIAEGGRIAAGIFQRDFGARDLTHSTSDLTYTPAGQETPAEALFVQGLIFEEVDANGSHDDVITIPDEILALLPPVKKLSFSETLVAAPDPAHVVAQGDVIRDIGMLLCYLQRETVRAVRVDRLAKRDLVRLNEDMSLRQDLSAVRTEEEAVWLAFVHHLAQLPGLIKVQGGIVSPSDKADEWLHQTRGRQTWEVWRCLTKDGTWSDLEHAISSNYLYSHPSPQYTVATRNRVLDTLKRCPPGRWFTIASFEQAIRTHDPHFARSAGARGSWTAWTMSYFYGGWADVESPLINYILTHTLAWLGVVQVGSTTEEAKPADFRLTEKGALLLGLSKGKLPEPASAAIVIQPNFEIVVPAEVSPATLFYLQQVADLSKRDRASIYTLSQGAIWRNLQAGGEIERIIAFLERASQRPLPQNVAYSLREWAAKHGEFVVDQVTLMTASTDALMAEVQANRKIGLRVQEVISPRAVTLGDGDATALVEQLKKAGYWPKAGKGIPSSPRAGTVHSTVTIKSGDLVHLLVGAMVLHHISEATGWQPPMSEALIRQLTWNLPPAVVKQVERMASEAIARYESEVGIERATEDGEE